MAMKSRKGAFWTFLHFCTRFLGLNGLIALAVGAFLWQALDMEEVGMYVLCGGAAAVALALLGEVRGLTQATFSRRGAAGFNGVLQIALATALVIGGNVFSFLHYQRFDCTFDRHFTLDPAIRTQLANLRGDTDIIVYLQHVSFGQRADLRQDDYDQAAEKVIVEKVKDLAAQFQELGPRFRVLVLDTQKKNRKEREKEINRLSRELSEEQLAANDNPSKEKPAKDSELLKTIKKAPEDSIFFYTPETKQLQRLSFNDIYQLDKKASEEANDGRGSLVLVDQGARKFADKIFKIEEKKPRVGFAVIHSVLGQDGREDIGMPGLKKTLAARGFEGRDIVLKKWPEREPAALEHEENRYEILELQKNYFERVLKALDEELKDILKARDYWLGNTAKEINKKYALVPAFQGRPNPVPRDQIEAARRAGRVIFASDVTEEFRAIYNAEWKDDIENVETDIKAARKKLDKAVEEQSKLRVENLAEQRRITDVRVKFNRLLADVDLLVVPRATIFNAVSGEHIPGRVYPLDDAQIEAIKDFMKAGKPVLFCLGPMKERGEVGGEDASRDSLEKLLASFNVQMPNQAILFNTEADALAEGDEREQLPGTAGLVDIPAATFSPKSAVGSSLLLAARGLSDAGRAELKIRAPRPVYVVRTGWRPAAVAGCIGAVPLGWPGGPAQVAVAFAAESTGKPDESAVFLMTDADCWNEDRPFANPAEKWIPHFERPKADDPNKGTVKERRRGPFPIGVVLESKIPDDWYESPGLQTPTKVRLAVIGQGGVFIGENLSPLREKLFLDVSNWLLGRENLLARENQSWQYPRVEMSDRTKTLWQWGARLGLPLLFLYVGFGVALVRRMR